MTKSEKQQWEQERTKGYNRYLLHAIVRKGLPFGVWMMLFYILWPLIRHQPIPPISKLLSMFGFFTLSFGWSMGSHTWRDNEKHYEEPTEDDDNAA